MVLLLAIFHSWFLRTSPLNVWAKFCHMYPTQNLCSEFGNNSVTALIRPYKEHKWIKISILKANDCLCSEYMSKSSESSPVACLTSQSKGKCFQCPSPPWVSAKTTSNSLCLQLLQQQMPLERCNHWDQCQLQLKSILYI
jgi:hypothetical protein